MGDSTKKDDSSESNSLLSKWNGAKAVQEDREHGEPMCGTKDPTNSQKSEKGTTTKGKKSSKTAQVNAGTKDPTIKATTRGKKPSTSSTAAEAQEPANLAQILQESFSNLASSMNEGFEGLGQMLKGKKRPRSKHLAEISSSDSESSDSEDSEHEPDGTAPPGAKRRKGATDQNNSSVLCEESTEILSQLEKNYNLTDQEGPAINDSLAKIVKNLMSEKTDEEKLNDIKKRYLKPNNCEYLTETKVNPPIWNNIADKARTTDIKLQKAQKALVKGITAVVNVVDKILNNSDTLPKNEIIDPLMDGVQLLANANIEVNIRRREALKPELHASYRHLCVPSNPITTWLFGDDLPKAVKDITDTNRITSKIGRDKKDYKRGRDNTSNKYQKREKFSGSKNYYRPFSNKRERGKKTVQKN